MVTDNPAIEKLDSKNKNQLVREATELAAKLEALKKIACQRSFWYFTRDIMQWPDIYEPLHKRVCDFIQDTLPTHNCLLLLPRGTFKSSIVTIGYPLWRIAQDINVRGMISNEIYGIATDFIKLQQKHLVNNLEFRDTYGDLSTGASVWREDGFSVAGANALKSKELTMKAFGITSGVTGSHVDFAILDDMVGRGNIKTKDGLARPITFYKDTIDLIDTDVHGRRPLIVIGTTWHHADLYGWLQDPNNPASKEFKVLKLPAYTGEWGSGELLFPPRLGWKAMEKVKNQKGPSEFSAQYMLNPVASESAAFKHFKYYEEEDIRGLKLNKFIAVDPAIGQSTESDYSAIVCVGIDSANNWYILDVWRDRVRPSRLIEQIFLMDAKWKPITTAIETVQFQQMLKYQIDIEMKAKNQFIPIKEIRHSSQSKLQRILGLEPRYAIGSVFHNSQIPFNEDLELELQGITQDSITSVHDDIVDALATINEIGFPPKIKEFRKSSIQGNSNNFYPA